MGPAQWPRYWVDHGWVQIACLVGPVAFFCVTRLRPRPLAAVDYAVHFHGARSARDGGLSLPPRRPVPTPYRSSVRLMNTGRSDLAESDLPDGVVITVRPPPRIMIGLVASSCLPRGAMTLEPVSPASVAVSAQALRPGDWMDVDLLTDQRVWIEGVSAPSTQRHRRHAPRRRRLRPYDGAQLVAHLIGLPLAVTAVILVGRTLPDDDPTTALDAAARYGWVLLAVWALISLWGLMDHSVRLATRSGWQGHPRVFLRWEDPPA